jgi:hypothetical protein
LSLPQYVIGPSAALTLVAAPALVEPGCFLAKGFTRLQNATKILLERFKDLLVAGPKLLSRFFHCFEVVDLSLNSVGVATGEFFVSAG